MTFDHLGQDKTIIIQSVNNRRPYHPELINDGVDPPRQHW